MKTEADHPPLSSPSSPLLHLLPTGEKRSSHLSAEASKLSPWTEILPAPPLPLPQSFLFFSFIKYIHILSILLLDDLLCRTRESPGAWRRLTGPSDAFTETLHLSATVSPVNVAPPTGSSHCDSVNIIHQNRDFRTFQPHPLALQVFGSCCQAEYRGS